MNDDREQEIRRRAYAIWEREGRSGDAQEHWLRAERQVSETIGESKIAAGKASSEAEKMSAQVTVAMEARNARWKQTGRAGSTGRKKPPP